MDIFNLEVQTLPYQILHHWFNTPPGLAVAQAFADELLHLPQALHGEYLLQLGYANHNPWLSILDFKHKWIASPCIDKTSALITPFLTLPIDRYQIDCILAPLTTEIVINYQSLLDEIDRVLKPLGHVIFWGINTYSLWNWGLRKQLWSAIKPTRINCSPLTLKHIFLARGYRQCLWREFYFIPPVTSKWLIRRLAFLNEMGKLLWPCPPGFYCLVLQKQVLNLIHPMPVSADERLSFA